MTITLAPQTEAKLKEMAVREGRDENALADALADALLADVLDAADRDHADMQEGIERGRIAYAAGRSRSFSEYVSEVMQRLRIVMLLLPRSQRQLPPDAFENDTPVAP